MERVDVLIAGAGPVGLLLAVLLRGGGASVVVVDRAPAPYGLPRAVAADAEVVALLARTSPTLVQGLVRDVPVRFTAADGRELGRLRLPPGPGGEPGMSFLRQPVLEERLAALAGPVRRGVTLRAIAQDRAGVSAQLGEGALRADWLVGCDGAGSTVRGLVQAGWRGRDLPDRWLVVDTAGPPLEHAFTYRCDPARPAVDMPVPGGRRWEWLIRGGGPALVPPLPRGHLVERAVEYRFAARRAARWRVGRVLLAGDAAHVMPPFAGAGLGAGLRDAHVLAGLLLAGDPASYQARREPHVVSVTRLSLLLGGLLSARRGARARDAALATAFRAPGLGPWLARGGPRAAGGL